MSKLRKQGSEYDDSVSYTHLDVYKRQDIHSQLIEDSVVKVTSRPLILSDVLHLVVRANLLRNIYEKELRLRSRCV